MTKCVKRIVRNVYLNFAHGEIRRKWSARSSSVTQLNVAFVWTNHLVRRFPDQEGLQRRSPIKSVGFPLAQWISERTGERRGLGESWTPFNSRHRRNCDKREEPPRHRPCRVTLISDCQMIEYLSRQRAGLHGICLDLLSESNRDCNALATSLQPRSKPNRLILVPKAENSLERNHCYIDPSSRDQISKEHARNRLPGRDRCMEISLTELHLRKGRLPSSL